ncbi:phytanoyl-CoA dioxygenase [Mucilaginibacter sp. PPCGB 2223]|uniref:phytanoyl-CoA dioxygenase family protein n=1 Tax=Mucilaginibacter sp. PPCGB 2223 TaxID=1886027 RepID=UPI0008254127|nr:phytanoyl-CoA dioxygenase family protein [Mucilaginibacter sp. PPCGB 2223]OCX54053.1 phytanoyl-CoA dioxygenase [Mucilaginibacter sp. PPCGB 2223]
MNDQNIAQPLSLAQATEVGKLGIMHLKRFWSKSLLKRINALKNDDYIDEGQLDKTLLYALGLGLEQTTIYIYTIAPSFDQFENWIVETAGRPTPQTTQRFNRIITGEAPEQGEIPQVLNADDLAFFEQHGYIIIKNAVPAEDCEKTIDTICRYIGIDRADPSTWYNNNQARQGIMVQLFQDPVMERNRNSVKIRQAYEQLWQRTDLWVSADRAGFNPPETEIWKFPGPNLHWDVSLQLPIPFGLQGILYLADTEENQGAFSLVPGFQHQIDDWINGLPEGADPRTQDLDALGRKYIAANAGDFIIWLKALPHGSSANTSTRPRYVQYINYAPAKLDIAREWK